MKLSIVDGIIQDDFLGRVPIVRSIIEPQGNVRNVRTFIALDGPIGVTIHNTGNSNPSADALAHAAWLDGVEAGDGDYIGAHFFVDAQRIVQVLPINEVSYHAGDGMGRGNGATVSIEICETAPYEECEAVAAMLLPVFLPFNLIKGGINAALTMLIYKPVTRALRSAHLLPEREDAPRANAAVKWTAIIAAIVLTGCIIAVLVIRHVI